MLNKTKSLCPICLEKIDAHVLIKNKKVVMSKECKKHGRFECHHAWDDPMVYKEMRRLVGKRVDTQTKDATIDVTYKCNMQCPFCFDTAVDEPDVGYIIRRAKDWGNGNILLYGGEPTLREDLPEIVRNLKDIRLGVTLLTNGLILDDNLAKKLDDAGLDGILLQIDALDDEVNKKMRGMNLLDEKLRAIESLNGTNIRLSFFVVIAKGVNENQIKEILSLAMKKTGRIRVVVFSPLSPEGKSGFERKHISNEEIFGEFEGLGLKKEDFMINTEFDIVLTNFLQRIGVDRKSIALCEALCYVYVKNNRLIPLNKLVDLRKLTEILENSNSLNSLLYRLITKKVRIDGMIFPLIGRLSIRMLKSMMTKKTLDDNLSSMFGIVYNPSQDRYNADYNFIKTCNLYSDNKNTFITFCEKNIFSTGKKDFKSLNEEYLINYGSEKNQKLMSNLPERD